MNHRTLWCCAVLSACGQQAPPPALPPLQLTPQLPRLRALAAGLPAAPSDQQQKKLRTLWEALFASERLAQGAGNELRDMPEAPWFLAQHLQAADPAHRRQAAWQLGLIGRDDAVPSLLLRMRDETDTETQLWFAEALSRLGNDAMLLTVSDQFGGALAETAGRIAIDMLRRAGTDPGEAPTYAALADGLRAAHTHWLRTGTARRAGGAASDTARQQPLLAQLVLGVEQFNLRRTDEARYVLMHSGVAALPLLLIGLAAEERYLRDLAVQVAGELGPVAAPLQQPLLALLRDELLAPAAIRALGALRATDATVHVRSRLDDRSLEIRCAAAGTLGLLGDRDSIARLRTLWQDQQQPADLRVQAAFSLAVFELEQPARDYLRRLRTDGTFHGPMLDRLLERLDRLDADRR